MRIVPVHPRACPHADAWRLGVGAKRQAEPPALPCLLAFFLVAAVAFSQPPPGRPPLRERAAAGDAEAQFTLGKNYEAGRSGLKKDYAEAASWYRKSADQGNVYAQASLGILYHSGKGLPHDDVQAEMWFTISADRAPENDRDTIVEMRDSVARHLTAQQLAEAQRMAHEWQAKK